GGARRVSRPVALLLPGPEAIDALAPEQLAPTLAALAGILTKVAARLAAEAAAAAPAEDLLDVDEVARLTRRSKSWLRHQGPTLPGFRQPRGRGTRVLWSKKALLAGLALEADGLLDSR